MAGLWRNNPETREGKYPVVLRRDGTVPEWEWLVVGQRDPCAPAAIRAYADEAERRGLDPAYVSDMRTLADRWEQEFDEGTKTPGDPDAPRHRTDDPDVLSFPGSLQEYREGGRYVPGSRKGGGV